MTNLTFRNALTGLRSSTVGLNTTSNNIANSNKEGYSRQINVEQFVGSAITGSGFQGQGSEVAGIKRAYQNFLGEQFSNAKSKQSFFTAKTEILARIDQLFADENAGISTALSDFFQASQDLSGNPADIPTRRVFLARAEGLADRFKSFNGVLSDIKNNTALQIRDMTKEVNSLSTQLAELNRTVLESQAKSPNGMPDNQLLDERELVLSKLAEKVEIDVVRQNNGSVSVFLANGQNLVSDEVASELSVRADESDRESLSVGVLQRAGDTTNFVELNFSKIEGGKLGGLVNTLKNEIPSYQGQIGLLAQATVENVNQVLQQGFDLNGAQAEPGVSNGRGLFDFAGVSLASVFAGFTNTAGSSLSGLQVDYSRLDDTDFTVRIESGGVLIHPDGKPEEVVTLTEDPPGSGSYSFDNGKLQFNLAGAQPGDKFFIKTTRNAADNIQVSFDDPSLISISGAADQIGDNTFALQLVSLQNRAVIGLDGQGFSLNDAFAGLVGIVGDDTRSAFISLGAKTSIFKQAESDLESLQGVNLDEEAGNLLKYQQAYQANGQVLSIARELFDDIINILR